MLIFMGFQKSSTQINRRTPCMARPLAFPLKHCLVFVRRLIAALIGNFIPTIAHLNPEFQPTTRNL